MVNARKTPTLYPKLQPVTTLFPVFSVACTRTRGNHWRESGARSPYRPFPDKPYFCPILEVIQSSPVSFIEKSRDMMMSWFCVGYFTHAAMTNDQREVLFQSQKEDKAAELVDYAKTLYDQQDERLKRRFPLAKPLSNQAALKLEFANGSRLMGVPKRRGSDPLLPSRWSADG